MGQAMEASRANKEAQRNYNYKLKVRERKWMQRRTTYASKKVQFEQEVDMANMAAQRAYTRTQIQLNNARSMAILQNQEDFKKMLSSEGAIEAKMLSRGLTGKSLARALVMNKGNFGMSQAMRARGLAQASYMYKETVQDVNRNLKGQLNRSFGKVAIQPVADLAPPAPVKRNVGMTLALGMAKAIGAGIEGMPDNSGGNYSSMGGSSTTTSSGTNIGAVGTMPSNPAFGYSNYAFSSNAATHLTGIPSGANLVPGSFGITSGAATPFASIGGNWL